jgi:nicotinamidase-related amidase
MKALIIIDVQNEFSDKGQRPVPAYNKLVQAIRQKAVEARAENTPVAWVRPFNKPTESAAFVPGSWGAEFVPGIGTHEGNDNEKEFQKNVYGAFTGTKIGSWLKSKAVYSVVIMGCFTHGCVSTTAREAIMEGLDVFIDSEGTGSCVITHPTFGSLSAEESKKAALLHLYSMGANILE